MPAMYFPTGLLEAGRAVWKASVGQSTGTQRCILLPALHRLCMCPGSGHAVCGDDVTRLSIMCPIGLVGPPREVCRWRTLFVC